jgi:hypothetical protein
MDGCLCDGHAHCGVSEVVGDDVPPEGAVRVGEGEGFNGVMRSEGEAVGNGLVVGVGVRFGHVFAHIAGRICRFGDIYPSSWSRVRVRIVIGPSTLRRD